MGYVVCTLPLVLAVGPVMGPVMSSVVIVAILVAATVATWISSWPDRKFRREVASREPLDDAQFFAQFYADSDVPPEIPRRLRPMYCKIFNVEVGKMRPAEMTLASSNGFCGDRRLGLESGHASQDDPHAADYVGRRVDVVLVGWVLAHWPFARARYQTVSRQR